MIVEALAGIPEIVAGDDISELIIDALVRSESGGLREGDVVVVTSKIISKAEGRKLPAEDRAAALAIESRRTVARRGPMSIVVTRLGITQAAAGIDNSNVQTGHILLLPADPDASARTIRTRLEQYFGCRLAVIISDTSGRAWRNGQTDHAIGLSGLTPIINYAGKTDAYGNALAVTAMAVADELAAAADLVKGKLLGRPVAVIRGAEVEFDDPHDARELIRDPAQDLFARGQREAVLWAVLATLPGSPSADQTQESADALKARFERLVALPEDDVLAAVCEGLEPAEALWAVRLLQVFG